MMLDSSSRKMIHNTRLCTDNNFLIACARLSVLRSALDGSRAELEREIDAIKRNWRVFECLICL